MKIVSMWIDFHHKKGLEEIRVYEYLAKKIPSGLSIQPLDMNGQIDGKTTRRIKNLSDELKPTYSNQELFSVTGRVWCKPDQIEEAKEILLDGLKSYTQKVINEYSVQLINFKTKSIELYFNLQI